MRDWFALPLAVAVLAIAAMPAAAERMSGHSQGGHRHGGHRHVVTPRIVTQGEVLPAFTSTNSLAALELHERLIRNGFNSEFRNRGFATRGQGDLGALDSSFGGWGWGWGGWGDTYQAAAPLPYPPQMVVVRAPRRPAAEERPTVEMTPDGVQIVRGPGSRHLMP